MHERYIFGHERVFAKFLIRFYKCHCMSQSRCDIIRLKEFRVRPPNNCKGEKIMSQKKNSFILYNDYAAFINMLDLEERGALFTVILDYVNGGKPDTDELSAGVRIAFTMIRQNLDRDTEKYQSICTKRSNAAKSAKASNCIQMHANATDNDNESESENDIEIENENENDFENESDNVTSTPLTLSENPDSSVMQAPPTVEQIKEYCKSRSSNIDPERFYDYYSANNWIFGRTKMYDWKAAVRAWEKLEHEKPAPPASKPSYNLSEMEELSNSIYRDIISPSSL